MKNFSLSELKLLCTVAEERTFSAAASRLEISGPSLSKKLNRLEEKAGHKLIHRPGKPIRMTAAGQIFLDMAKQTLLANDQAEAKLRNLTTGTQLNIIVNPSVAIVDLPGVIHQIRQKNRIPVKITSGSFKEIIEAVQDGVADVGMLTTAPKVEGVHFFSYRADKLSLLAPLTHPLAQKRKVSLAEIAEFELVGATDDRQITTFLATHAEQAGLTLRYGVVADNFDVQASMTSLGDMPAIMLDSIARRYERIYLVKAIPLADTWAHGNFYICAREHDSRSQAASEFIHSLTTIYPGHKK